MLLDNLLLVNVLVVLAKLGDEAEGGRKHVGIARRARVLLCFGQGGVIVDYILAMTIAELPVWHSCPSRLDRHRSARKYRLLLYLIQRIDQARRRTVGQAEPARTTRRPALAMRRIVLGTASLVEELVGGAAVLLLLLLALLTTEELLGHTAKSTWHTTLVLLALLRELLVLVLVLVLVALLGCQNQRGTLLI